MKLVRLFIFFLIITSCKESIQITQGGNYNSKTRKYTSHRINWQITIPEKWEITNIDTLRLQAKKGLDNIEFDKSKTNQKKEIKSQYLIGFKKNNRNSFTSFIDEVEYDESNIDLINQRTKLELLEQLNKQGIKADTIWSKKTISNIDFTVFHLIVRLPNSETDFHQEYYNTFISDKYFTILIGYDNSEDKKLLLKSLSESKFAD